MGNRTYFVDLKYLSHFHSCMNILEPLLAAIGKTAILSMTDSDCKGLRDVGRMPEY